MEATKHPALGFIGFGEAAFEISKGLISEKGLEILAYDKFMGDPAAGKKIRSRAEEAGVTLVDSIGSLAGSCDVIVSAVVSAVVVDVAKAAAEYLGRRNTYVDMNSSSPKTKVAAEEFILPTGAMFVDLAIMGPVPTFKHKVPALASGNGAKAATQYLSSLGMNVKYVSDHAGDTSSIKMLRSIFMKGAAALLIEMLCAAERCGTTGMVMDSVVETLTEVQPKALVKRLVTGTAVHSERRAHEMQEVIETLQFLGSPFPMAQATKEVLEWVTTLNVKDAFKGEVPSEPMDTIKTINELHNDR